MTILLMLSFMLGLAVGIPESGRCRNQATGGGACSLTGTSSTYTETITGDMRQIRASGCPNNNPLTVCIGDNPNPGSVNDWQVDVPAVPKFKAGSYEASKAAALDLAQVGGLIGITLNGIEIRSCFGGQLYGSQPCLSYESSATYFEGDTFEYCGGHGNPYHYHGAPVCLIQQMGPRSDGSSPQVGWALDGFPLYGNRGPAGVLMKRCTEPSADKKYCTDACGGYYGNDWNDQFQYRYFLMGPDSDFNTNPLSPQPGKEYFPFSPLCFLGCGSNIKASGATGASQVSQRSMISNCGGDSLAGTANGYVPIALQGVTVPYAPQQKVWSWTEASTEAPIEASSEAPTEAPTEVPTEALTEAPTEASTEAPTEAPTEAHTETPTEAPTKALTEEPTVAPTDASTGAPSEASTETSTEAPTKAFTKAPTDAPTGASTGAPTETRTKAPTEAQTQAPTRLRTQTPASGKAATISSTANDGISASAIQDSEGGAPASGKVAPISSSAKDGISADTTQPSGKVTPATADTVSASSTNSVKLGLLLAALTILAGM